MVENESNLLTLMSMKVFKANELTLFLNQGSVITLRFKSEKVTIDMQKDDQVFNPNRLTQHYEVVQVVTVPLDSLLRRYDNLFDPSSVLATLSAA